MLFRSSLRRVARAAEEWTRGRPDAARAGFPRWTTHERLQFLRRLPPAPSAEQLRSLDRDFQLTRSTNVEIAFQWLLMAIRGGYAPADDRLEEFLVGIGRRKFIKPLYEELVKTDGGRQRARDIYRKARPGYHPIAVDTVDRIVESGV